VRVKGLDAAGVAEVVSVSRFGPDALNLVFRVDGRVGERLVYRGEESAFEIVEVGRAYAFDADGGLLRLASEAYRIRLAHLFDPYLAVSASQIEALPHQITAVYGEMLPRQPLRFLLADDPGAGKMIMAGLLIKELMIRGDLERCLIVAPGGLVEQWQDELAEKFGLAFDILTRDQIEASITGNPFVEKHRLILRPRRQVAPARIHSRRTDHAGPGDRLTPEDPDLHRAQGEYLHQKIMSRVGDPASVVVIHGGIAREARRAAIAAFNSDPVVRVMIANDAAGEASMRRDWSINPLSRLCSISPWLPARRARCSAHAGSSQQDN
jgi:hypothetical protein